MDNIVTPIDPSALKCVGGFMGQRFEANRTARLKDPILAEQFIRLHERKNHDDWFWMGEQIGKWLDAATYTGLIAKDGALLDQVNQFVDRLEKAQAENGYLGITQQSHRDPVRGMELYENYYVLLGLKVVYRLLGNDKALRIATRLGDFITETWGTQPGQFPLVGPFPGNGHDGGEGTLILEPIIALSRLTGNPKYVIWAEKCLKKWDEWWARYPVANHSCGWTNMRKFASGELDLWELRANMHAHTYHMTLLAIADLYNTTNNEEYRDVVLKSIDRIASEWLFLTGGMSSGERYVQREYYHPRNNVEVCPQHTWILLLEHALRWTGEARYAAEIERDLFNHFLAAQLADGSNWSYMTALNGRAQEPEGPNCCNASGHRIAGRMPTYLYGLRYNNPAIFMFTESEAEVEQPNGSKVTLSQRTGYPSDGQVIITVIPDRERRFALHVRIPPFAQGATWSVNGSAAQSAQAGDFLVIERTWQAGDQVELVIPMPLTVQANDHAAAVMRGPLVYCLFQNIQDQDGQIFWHQGIYPEDHRLVIDPQNLAATIHETATPEGLLGPALRVTGVLQARTPIFAAAAANQSSRPAEHEEVILVPFVNQGSIRGDYRIFNEIQPKN